MRAFIVNGFVRFFIKLTVKIDRQSKGELAKVPLTGPGLIITNHVSNVEGPLIYTKLQPRKTIAMGKTELWDKWVTRTLMEAWKCIPIKRGAVDQGAIRECMSVIEEGNFLCLAPEGTRSKNGIVQQAKAGISLFAKPEIPIIPIAIWGLENYSKNLKRLKRTPIQIRVGESYFPHRPEGRFTSEKRQDMVDEMMLTLVRLLPEEYWGFYKDHPSLESFRNKE